MLPIAPVVIGKFPIRILQNLTLPQMSDSLYPTGLAPYITLVSCCVVGFGRRNHSIWQVSENTRNVVFCKIFSSNFLWSKTWSAREVSCIPCFLCSGEFISNIDFRDKILLNNNDGNWLFLWPLSFTQTKSIIDEMTKHIITLKQINT